MKNEADYSLYKCPYEHVEKECGHALHGPEFYETYGVWCSCGFRGPVFCLDPEVLNLDLVEPPEKDPAEAQIEKTKQTLEGKLP